MASSDNLVSVEQQPWRFGQGMADCWISELFNKETETLTKALTKSFANPPISSTDVESLIFKPETTTPQTPSGSGGSEHEFPVAKRRNVGATGRITKRKSRASKRATTTFINADPANFREMVQQVTGIRFAGDLSGRVPVPQVLKPDPRRPISMFQAEYNMPTLDTSSFLLDQQVAQPPVVRVPPPSTAVADAGSAEFNFDSFCSFPTLESWKVM